MRKTSVDARGEVHISAEMILEMGISKNVCLKDNYYLSWEFSQNIMPCRSRDPMDGKGFVCKVHILQLVGQKYLCDSLVIPCELS